MSSSDLRFKQQMRNRKRKQKFRRTVFLSLLVIVIITVLAFAVKGIFSQNKKSDNEEIDFIFNGYVYPEPPVVNTDILTDVQKADGNKVCYLTFDDGPNNSVTLEVLDILRRYNAKATFFMVGSLIEKNPDVARRVYEEGHLIANHSYSHNYKELYSAQEGFMNEVTKTQQIINNVTGNTNYPKVFRFPGGGYKAGKYGDAKQQYKLWLGENGFRYCDWNSLSGDAESKSPTEESVIKRVKSTSEGKEDVVILMHDAAAKTVTAKTLSRVIEYLISQGYVFDRLDNA